MSTLTEIFSSHFLLHNALWGSLAVGFFCPLIGVYFMLRRMTLLGVALPQISAAGIAFAFLLQGLGVHWSLHAGEANDRFLALLGSFLFSSVALAGLAWFERRREGSPESRIGALYALAYALSILFVSANASGKIEMLSMLHGEIVSVTSQDLRLLVWAYGALTAILILFNRKFLLVSYDRDFAKVLGNSILAWDAWLFAMIGIAIAMGVIIVGPMLTFAFLIIPPLAARRFCRHMASLFALSGILGGAAALVGFLISYQWDLPLGPTDMAVSFLSLVLAVLVKRLF
jgi:ABC-type Mn2+/Zn2+ transport system permease subunit